MANLENINDSGKWLREQTLEKIKRKNTKRFREHEKEGLLLVGSISIEVFSQERRGEILCFFQKKRWGWKVKGWLCFVIKGKFDCLCQMLGWRYKCRGVGYNFHGKFNFYIVICNRRIYWLLPPSLNITTYCFFHIS